MYQRKHIHNWKADAPFDSNINVGKQKYSNENINTEIRKICAHLFNNSDFRIIPKMSGGNHGAYIVETSKKKYMLRTDISGVNDNYFYVESMILTKVSNLGIPVPKIVIVDTSNKFSSFKFQLMEFIEGESINKLFKKDTLRDDTIVKIGDYLRKIHSVTIDNGFGHFKYTPNGEELIGLVNSNFEFINCKLNSHVDSLLESDLISIATANDIKKIFVDNQKILDIPVGHLLHRDFGFYNMVGTDDEVYSINDWNDACSGDPLEDVGILAAHYEPDVLELLLTGYNSTFSGKDLLKVNIYKLRCLLYFALGRIELTTTDTVRYLSARQVEDISALEYTLSQISETVNTIHDYGRK